eukprot:scaffold140378_cov32-Tisochrysis_lutea.AAC.1
MKAALTSIVTPRSRSSAPWSSKKAYLKDALPRASASFAHRCRARESTCPARRRRRPIKVDLPASTCPTTTRFSCSDMRGVGAGWGPCDVWLPSPLRVDVVVTPPESLISRSSAASTEPQVSVSAEAAFSGPKPISTNDATAASVAGRLLAATGSGATPSPGGTPSRGGGRIACPGCVGWCAWSCASVRWDTSLGCCSCAPCCCASCCLRSFFETNGCLSAGLSGCCLVCFCGLALGGGSGSSSSEQ